MKKKKTKIKNPVSIKRKKQEENRGILMVLIAFVIFSVSIFFLIKLSDWGYLGEKKESGGPVAETIFSLEVRKEVKEFKGFVFLINQEKNVFGVEIFEPEDFGETKVDFYLDNSTEIYLVENGEDILLKDILPDDLVVVKAIYARGKKWIAEKIEVEPLTVFLGEVKNKSLKNLSISRSFSNPDVSEVIYEVAIEARTKIIIKDQSRAFDDEENFDASKVLEKNGSLADIQEDSRVMIYAEENSIPRKGGEITASKIEIFL